MELLLNPLFEAHLANALDVARTRPISQAVERVDDGFVFGKFRDGKFAFEFLVEGCGLGGSGNAGVRGCGGSGGRRGHGSGDGKHDGYRRSQESSARDVESAMGSRAIPHSCVPTPAYRVVRARGGNLHDFRSLF